MAQTPEYPDDQNSQNSQQPQQGYYYPYGARAHPNQQADGGNAYASSGNQYYRAQARAPLAFGQGEGKINVADALQYGFSAAMRNGTPWIIGSLLFVAVYILYRGVTFFLVPFEPLVGNMVTSVVVLVFSLLLSCLIAIGVNGALRQMDEGIVPVGDFIRGRRLFVAAVLIFVSSALMSVMPAVAVLFAFETQDSSPPLMAVIATVCLAFVIGALVFLLVSMVPFYVIDGQDGIASSMSRALSDSARNFFPLLLLWIVVGVANAIGSLLCGIGLVATLPVSFLALSYAYRQMSRGRIQLLTSRPL